MVLLNVIRSHQLVPMGTIVVSTGRAGVCSSMLRLYRKSRLAFLDKLHLTNGRRCNFGDRTSPRETEFRKHNRNQHKVSSTGEVPGIALTHGASMYITASRAGFVY